MKGLILAGGKATRLYPTTKVINKHLLPVWDKPLIMYAIEALRDADITDIYISLSYDQPELFIKLLGKGEDEEGKVWLVERQTWREDTVVLDVRRNVLVMRTGVTQREVVGMRLGIVPVKLIIASINGVRVVGEGCCSKVNHFIDSEGNVILEV